MDVHVAVMSETVQSTRHIVVAFVVMSHVDTNDFSAVRPEVVRHLNSLSCFFLECKGKRQRQQELKVAMSEHLKIWPQHGAVERP